MNTLRWGILGAARIARKNWKAIRHSGNSKVTAVASRDPARARQFVAECQSQEPFATPPTVMDDYEELIASPEIDAVYMPLPTALRKQWVIRAAQAGKHVLSEKPAAVSLEDLREMIESCRQHQVQFMDGVMFMHHARLQQIRAALDGEATLGRLRRINSHFSFLGTGDFFTQNIRVQGALEPLGCLGDLGWYCVRFSLWAMNWQLPVKVTGRILAAVQDVPTAFTGDLLFAEGVSANFYCSFLEQHQQWTNLSCQNGFLRVSDFVLPLKGSATAFELHHIASRQAGGDYVNEPITRSVAHRDSPDDPRTAQETNMIRNFVMQAQSGQLNDAWMEQALSTQQVISDCMASAQADGR